MRSWRLPLVVLCVCMLTCTPLISESHVSSAQWKALKQQLTGPSGGEYFEKYVKDCLLPSLEGTLVSSQSVEEGDEFLVALQNDTISEVKLRLKRHLQSPLPAGTPVVFEGVAKQLVAEPFLVVFDVEDVNRATKTTK